MKQFILHNKLLSTILGFLFTSLITYNILWGTWVTNKIFCHGESLTSHVAVQVAEEKAVSQQVREVKADVKEVKDELSKLKKEAGEEGIKLRKDITDNQKELLKLLIQIKNNKK